MTVDITPNINELPKYQRKCANWLTSFGEWTLPRSEAPETFIFWTGLFTLACVLRRKVFIPKTMLGSWSVSPNLYILFIAPAGKARKSTTANYTEDLLDNIPNITKSPELVTKEKLLERLVKSNDASMYIVAPEFGEFIAKSGPSMFGFLTNMFDGKKNISSETIGRSADFAEKPCVNMLGATTPEVVAELMPASVIGGGFASRVIFIPEERVRRRKLWYDDLDHVKLEHLRSDLMADLLHISENIDGEYKIDPEAQKYVADWYDKNAEGDGAGNYKMSGYFERKPAHVLKVAIILHVAYSDEMVLYKKDFEDAIILIEQVEKKLPTVFQSVGRNQYAVDIYRILDYIVEKGRVAKDDVFRHFMHAAEPIKLEELINGLGAAGYIEVEIEGMFTYLKPSAALSVTP